MSAKHLVAGTAAMLAVAAGWPAAAVAQPYPERTINVIVPALPGSTIDTFIRLMGPRLTAAWGQSIVADSRPGAGQSLGAEVASRAKPDGYTLLISTNAPITINPVITKVGYDPLRDFDPVIRLGQNALVLVTNSKLPVTSVAELVALAKRKPKALNAGSSGNGTTAHLSLVQFNKLADVDIVHVPYKGGPPSLTAVMSGEVEMVFSDPTAALPLVKDGRLRLLASSGTRRSSFLPAEVPTVAESGVPGFSVEVWVGVFAPKGTPGDIVRKINNELARQLKDPQAIKQMLDIGLEVNTNTPEEFAEFLRREVPRWRDIVVQAGVKAD